MASPAKKRKLNNESKNSAIPSRGLEYFFSKQKDKAEASSSPSVENSNGVKAADADSQILTDEELARKLQAEWNQLPGSDAVPERDFDESVADGAPVTPQKQPEPLTSTAASTPGSVIRSKGGGTLSLQSMAAAEDHVSNSIPLDESPLSFDPSKHITELKEHWASEGGDASYALLTRCFVLINGTTSRIKIVDTLVNCLRILIEGDPSSLLPAVYTSLLLVVTLGRLC